MSVLSRRSALALPLAMLAMLARPALAAPIQVTDALGHVVTLKAPPERIVFNFNFEEFTAAGGAGAWDPVVGFSRGLWADWRAGSYRRYLPAIPRLATLGDVGHTDGGDFSIEKVIALRPDLLLLADWAFQTLKPQVALLEALGVPTVVIDFNAQIPELHRPRGRSRLRTRSRRGWPTRTSRKSMALPMASAPAVVPREQPNRQVCAPDRRPEAQSVRLPAQLAL
jgi:ABC-type Fe3+-hydroxamate transport system substrate-binding protein